jgi:hypothetical protein
VLWMLIPVAAQSKVWVCGRSLPGIAGSSSNGGMVVCLSVCSECCVLSGKGLSVVSVVCCQVQVCL